jgi:hypothetical protein
MPVNRSFYPDLASEEVCEFVRSYRQTYSEVDLKRVERVAQGYKSLGTPRDVAPSAAINATIPMYQRRYVEVALRSGRLVNTVEIEEFGYAKVDVLVQAILSCRNGLSTVHEASLLKAFQGTTLDLASVDQAETDLINSGVGLQDFQVDLVLKLELTEPLKFLSDNVSAFAKAIEDERDAGGKKIYTAKVLEKIINSCKSQLPPSTPPTVTAPADREKVIVDEVRKDNPICEDLTYTEHEFLAWKVPEFMLQEQRDRVFICGVDFGEVTWYKAFFRQTDTQLVGAVVAPSTIMTVARKVFFDCMVEAGVATSLVLIFTSGQGLPLATTVFVSYVERCIELKLGPALECVVPKLFVASSAPPPWQPV